MTVKLCEIVNVIGILNESNSRIFAKERTLCMLVAIVFELRITLGVIQLII